MAMLLGQSRISAKRIAEVLIYKRNVQTVPIVISSSKPRTSSDSNADGQKLNMKGIPNHLAERYFLPMRRGFQKDRKGLPSRISILDSASFSITMIQSANPENDNDFAVMFVIGKKAVSKFAVYRVRARRRLKAAFSIAIGESESIWWRGFDFVATGNVTLLTTEWEDLLTEVKTTLERLKKNVDSSHKETKATRTKAPRLRWKQ